MAPDWYLGREGQALGPYTLEQLKDFSSAGKLSPSDMVWHHSLGEWRSAAAVNELSVQSGGGNTMPPAEQPPVGGASAPWWRSFFPAGKNIVVKFALPAVVLAVIVLAVGLTGGAELAFKLLGFIFTGIFIFSMIKTAVSFRSWKMLQVRTLYITAATAPLALFVYILLLQVGTGWLFYLLLGMGTVAGLIWGLTTKLQTVEGAVYSRGTMWGFLIWGGLVALLQLSNLFFNISPGPLVLLLALKTGVMAVYNLSMAWRCRKTETLAVGTGGGH